jgi:hypothetical protein
MKYLKIYSLFSFTNFCYLKKNIFWKKIISENNIINVEAAKVVGYFENSQKDPPDPIFFS